MALIKATTVAGLAILFYLSTFILFAIIRITTGVSVQRVGYLSLRHISFTPKEGFRIDLRGFGFTLHRPSFAQPTWVSLKITDLKITLDPLHFPKSSTSKLGSQDDATETDDGPTTPAGPQKRSRSKLWRQLTDAKETIKKIHGRIHWLRMLDFIAENIMVEIVGVGSVQLGLFTGAVHTRRKFLDRGRLFRHKKEPTGEQKPAEWIFVMKSLLLAIGDNEPVELLDALTINVHGLLYKDREGLRDTSIAIKLGRLHIPVDDVLQFQQQTKTMSESAQHHHQRHDHQTKPISTMQSTPNSNNSLESREAMIVQTVADSREFVSSALQSVQEIQLAMTFVRISKELESLRQASRPITMNVVTHEVGFDLHRLDQISPAHRMYFQQTDVAHQALLAAISISVSLDDDDSNSNKILYIPMATTTVKTTLPSKTMQFTESRDVTERNANILFANLVITSPSVDLTPRHLVQVLALSQQRHGKDVEGGDQHHHIISRLLPKASIKVSIHEPVVRFVLPTAHDDASERADYDMIISAISSISLEIESSHSADADLLYSLVSHFRLVSHHLYYQAASGIKHNLMLIDSLELRTQLVVSDEVRVIVTGTLRSFSILMVREEVSGGVFNIVRHFKHNIEPDKLDEPNLPGHTSFLRKMPAWLVELHLEGFDCSAEVAGIDRAISKETRGIALQLESWSADYLCQSANAQHKSQSRRRPSMTMRADETLLQHRAVSSPPPAWRKHPQSLSDGRRLAIHVRGFEGFIIESLDTWEPQPFLAMPRMEVAFSTSRDLQGPIFHVNSHVRAIYFEWSLYRFYSGGVAGIILKDAFLGPPINGSSGDTLSRQNARPDSPVPIVDQPHSHVNELLTIDVKTSYIQVKADMPSEPALLLQLYEVAAGRHRWSAPFVRADLLRLHAEPPGLRRVWARIISMNVIRIDIRPGKKKTATGLVDEKSYDLATDFIRIAVPRGLTTYKVFDNIVNTKKAVEQLHHRFRTRTNDYILQKVPERPKHMPKVSLRCKALMFELEDDPFEWRLGVIYHVGQAEQRQRLARADAFRVKVKRLNEDRHPRASSRTRVQSSRRASPTPQPGPHFRSHPRRSRSHNDHHRTRSHSRGRKHRDQHKLRYQREGVCSLTRSAKIQASAAWDKLQEHNARSWKKRVDATLTLQNTAIRNIRRLFSGADEPPHDADETEVILGIPNRPGLMSLVISDLHLVVDKPSFPLHELPKFIHDIGKGMPLDMDYTLLVPLHLSMDMGEARMMLRDYPLSLLHIPAIRPGQPPRLPSWSLRTDLVIAEEFRDDESSRHVKIDIVPKGKHGASGAEVPGFSIDVRRTVAPVKNYSKPTIEINTNQPTAITWGTSYQPVVQDMMMIIENFTKPPIDPSERVGFWDKIRLGFHSRLVVKWKGDGDVQLRLKGSRDPYVVTGYGAGFTMCWRGDTEWAVHSGDDPRQFMTVKSGEYLLAIPDYSHQARQSTDDRLHRDEDSMSSGSSQKNNTVFKKVIMKLSGHVQWTAGLVFERDLDDGSTSFKFRPHYEVILKNPKQLDPARLKGYDAYRGFRSEHIHLSVGVSAPADRDWTTPNPGPSHSYNAFHLSPRFFSHFWDWWHLFSGNMSLPIRQGPLWRGPEKPSKKFGRHLATIKYGLLLSPVYIAHVYKHKDMEDYQEETVSATGLKLRMDSFMLDLHQRRESFDTMSKVRGEHMRTSGLKMNKAELDFVSADLRAVAASIGGTTADDLLRASDEIVASYQDPSPTVDMSQFTIPDHDFSWIDMDDFVELDWVLPAESNPETKILPLAYTPRFTYFRQTEYGGAIQGDPNRTSPFGEEPSHFCVMSRHNNDPREVQMALIRSRLTDLESQLSHHQRLMGEQELLFVRDGQQDEGLKNERECLFAQERELLMKQKFLQHGLKRLEGHQEPGEMDHHGRASVASTTSLSADSSAPHVDMEGLFAAPHEEFASDFNNRFIAHNVQLKWNNALRNIILRYSHQVSQRRGFVYYMSRRAVKFILDIVDEQAKSAQASKVRKHERSVPPTPSVISPTDEKDDEFAIQDRIEQLLNDAKRYVDADEVSAAEPEPENVQRTSTVDMGGNIAEQFLAMNAYHIRLIAPQIQLQSEKNTKAVVLVSAKGMQFKVISIMDKERLSDDVSGLVQRRYSLDMDGAQFFVTNQKLLARFLHLYSGNRYGNAPGSSWPPWVPLEVMFDFQLNPFGFQRVIQKTSALLRYEKYNQLRLKYNEQVASKEGVGKTMPNERNENRIDHLWVDFPRIRASCDSNQYYTMYIIVLDLLLYSEPLEKTRSERLEKIMLASDFSDLRGAPEMATNLQDRIRQLEEIKLHFQINAKYLDRDGWQDRVSLEKDLALCEDELFFIMKAITTSQQRMDERKTSESSGLLRWYLSASEIVWHLMRDKNEPLLEFQLGDAAYERIDNSDGSNHNATEIGSIRGINLLPNAIYPDIIGPYHDNNSKEPYPAEPQKMLQVHWYMLEAIAGIPVLEEFEVRMFPLKVQLERDLGKKLFEYIFPQAGAKTAEKDKNVSPFMVKQIEAIQDGDDLEAEEAETALQPEMSLHSPTPEELNSTAPGAMGRRLRPTYHLGTHQRHASNASSSKPRGLSMSPEHHFNFLKHSNTSSDSRVATIPENTRKSSSTSLASIGRRDVSGSSTSLVTLGKAEEKKHSHGKEKKSKHKKNKDEKPSDDLSQMVARASNYMTLAHVKMNSFVICLSYKGKGDRNLEDLHSFVFRMPTLEYSNKTWSNLDLALRLKRDVIKALISHTGAIIGNKFTHHRPGKQAQSKLRELAKGHALLPNSDTLVNTPSTSETASLYSLPQNGDEASPRMSFQSTPAENGGGVGSNGIWTTPLIRTGSYASSISQMSGPVNGSMLSLRGNMTGSGIGLGINRPPTGDLSGTLRPSTAAPHHRSLLKETWSLGRQFTNEIGRVRRASQGNTGASAGEEGELSDPEAHRKKSVLLLGKKILGSLS